MNKRDKGKSKYKKKYKKKLIKFSLKDKRKKNLLFFQKLN